MTNEDIKIKRGEFLQATIKKYVESEPKLELPDLAYLIWQLGDEGIIDVEKLVKLIVKETKNKF